MGSHLFQHGCISLCAEGVDLVFALEIAALFPSCSDSESVSSRTFLLCLEAAAGIVGFAFLLLLDLDEDIVVNGDNFKK